jgi:hypothetical protein
MVLGDSNLRVPNTKCEMKIYEIMKLTLLKIIVTRSIISLLMSMWKLTLGYGTKGKRLGSRAFWPEPELCPTKDKTQQSPQ